MIPIAGANCIYFEPNDLGGVCKHPDVKRGFWIFSYKGNCVLTRGEIECELRKPKITATIIEQPKPVTPTKKSAHKIHIHKHIHKHKER